MIMERGMKMFWATDGRGHQSAFRIMGSRIVLLLILLILNNFSYAICVNETGLGLIDIEIETIKKQAQIFKEVTSKQTLKRVMPRLNECTEQRRRIYRIFDGDVRIWARTEAKGDKSKLEALTKQIKRTHKTRKLIGKEFKRIHKVAPDIDTDKLARLLLADDKRFSKVKYPERSLLGHWYALSDYIDADKRRIATEFQFMKNGFAVIDPALVRSWGVSYGGKTSLGTQEVVKWNIEVAKNFVPLSMSMGKSNKELKNFSWYLVKLNYMRGKPERIRGSKKGEMRTKNLTKTAYISFIVNFKTGVLLLRNNHNKERASTHSDFKLYREKALPENSNYFFKRWPDSRQTMLDENKKLISELCAKWRKESIKNPYCKKFIVAIGSVSEKQKVYIPTSDQKQAILAAKNLTKVASQYLFKPIKDYSDSTPIPTRLAYDSLATIKCQSDIDAWHAERKSTKFADTLWSLRVSPKRFGIQPGDNKEEYFRYMKALILWSNFSVNTVTGIAKYGTSAHIHIVHLRKDGVFGLSWSPDYVVVEKNNYLYFSAGKESARIYYDPANRWAYKGKGTRIELYWQNSKQAYPLGNGTAKYESFAGGMIQNYNLLSQVVNYIPGGKNIKTPVYAELAQRTKTEQQGLSPTKNNCNGSKASSSAAAIPKQKTPQTQSSTVKDTKAKMPKPVAPKKTLAGTLTGCWNWSNGGYIVIAANGKARNGAVKASWKTVDKVKGRYMIIWPPITDTLTLSKNGKALSGSNSFGSPVSAKRKTGTSASLFGRWQWSNGMAVNIHPDNTVSAGFFHGKLKKTGKHWNIEWPVDDAIILSADGNNLNIQNQFGALTAVRDTGCKKR